MTTMKDIATATGVSISTVSLVLNGRDAGRVNRLTAAQVRDTAHRLGYISNPLARSLRTGRTRILGFVSEHIATTPFAGGIILGAQEAAIALGYMLLTVNADNQRAEADSIAMLARYGVDGVLYAKMSNQYTDVPQALVDYPLVLVDATDKQGRFSSIEPDEFTIGLDATARLIAARCRRIAYIGAPDTTLAQHGRFAGYRQALDNGNIQFDDRLVVNVDDDETALRAVSDLFDREHPDGFFCFNDARAWYVYECAARRGLIIGKDVSVIGVDNHQIFAQTLIPRLTTVELPHYEMGYWATMKLVSLIEGGVPETLVMPQTTAPLPPLDATVPAQIHCALIEKASVRA